MKRTLRQAFGVSLIALACWGVPASAETSPLPTYDRVRILQEARDIPDAELIDHNGHPFKLSQLNGRVALVFLGFTNCPDVCPLAMAKMMQLQASRGAGLEDIAYVMISVDGERDTPEAMKKFLTQYSPQFIGLTGDPQSIKPIAKEFSVAFFKGAGTGHNYDVSHSPQVFVMDQAGRLRAEFYNASIEAMTGVTQALIEEGGP